MFAQAKKLGKWAFGTVVVLEVASCAVFMTGAFKLNRDPDFRRSLADSRYGRPVLDNFYAIGEKFVPDFDLRQQDLKQWGTNASGH